MTATSVLLAATNHPELIDPALWRRFDLVVQFKTPDEQAVKEAIKRFLGPDYALFARWIDILVFAFAGHSFSDIERDVQRFRRAVALGTTTDADLAGPHRSGGDAGQADPPVPAHCFRHHRGEPGHDPKVHQ
ncbi:hypothetical protein G6F63_015440 [Rhizopus arrhizus]|nr:hypothetical protein G6F63_015440 [Rhizopus arrhizus]